MGKKRFMPTLQPPPMKPAWEAAYFRDRFNEAKDRMEAGLPVDLEQAKADWCAWQVARLPLYVWPVVKREAPKPASPERQKQLLSEFGF
jgi:hypothetical protein